MPARAPSPSRPDTTATMDGRGDWGNSSRIHQPEISPCHARRASCSSPLPSPLLHVASGTLLDYEPARHNIRTRCRPMQPLTDTPEEPFNRSCSHPRFRTRNRRDVSKAVNDPSLSIQGGATPESKRDGKRVTEFARLYPNRDLHGPRSTINCGLPVRSAPLFC
jgi:hypothetical protein